MEGDEKTGKLALNRVFTYGGLHYHEVKWQRSGLSEDRYAAPWNGLAIHGPIVIISGRANLSSFTAF